MKKIYVFHKESEQTDLNKDCQLFQIHGSSAQTSSAVEVNAKATSLNSHDCFVLATLKETFVWLGKSSTGDEREIAKTVAEVVADGMEITTIFEGQEKQDFWKCLGGKAAYISEQSSAKSQAMQREPRLFHCSNASGRFQGTQHFLMTVQEYIAPVRFQLRRS